MSVALKLLRSLFASHCGTLKRELYATILKSQRRLETCKSKELVVPLVCRKQRRRRMSCGKDQESERNKEEKEERNSAQLTATSVSNKRVESLLHIGHP